MAISVPSFNEFFPLFFFSFSFLGGEEQHLKTKQPYNLFSS